MNELLNKSPIKPPGSIITSPLKNNDRNVTNSRETGIDAGDTKREDDILPVSLKLGSTKLIFTDNGWKVEDSNAAMYQNQKIHLRFFVDLFVFRQLWMRIPDVFPVRDLDIKVYSGSGSG